MNLLEFSLWTIAVMLPGFLLSRLFLFISGGWRDLLIRLFVSHCAAILCIGNLAIMILRTEALSRAVLVTTVYVGAQLAWFGIDMIRYNLGNVARPGFSLSRVITAVRLPEKQARAELAK